MRLRQLSRKLDVKTDKILEFLQKSGHSLGNDANAKLTDDQVALVEAKYPAPVVQKIEEEIAKVEVVEEVEVTETVEANIEKEAIIEIEVPFAPPSDVTSQVSKKILKPKPEIIESPEPKRRLFKAVEEPDSDPNIEVIKAPIIKLEGLKVLGKIELPEQKPKAENETEGIVKEETPRKKLRNVQKNRASIQGEHQNPVERERLRQEKIAARRKRDAEQKIKAKKTENYIKQVTPKPVTAKPKRKKKEVITPYVPTSAPILGQNRPQQKVEKVNKLKKFWGWLNGKYDKY